MIETRISIADVSETPTRFAKNAKLHACAERRVRTTKVSPAYVDASNSFICSLNWA